MPRPVTEQVVVITGASSGIGRETALQFARRGAAVVLLARNLEALQEVEHQIASAGGRALAIAADVADWGQVQGAAQQAAQRFGRIDTWVNNAGVSVYGSFRDVAPEEFGRVVAVNLMGQVHGAKAALPYLRQSGGTLIGITSSVGQLPVPLSSAYGASKNGLMAFYRILRLEQAHERSGVRVTVIVPAGIDTPLFEHAKTYLGVKPSPGQPAYPARLVAEAILHAAQVPVRRIVVGGPVAAGLAFYRVAPRLFERIVPVFGYRGQRTRQPKPPSGPSNLWEPMPGKGSVSGGFRTVPFDPYTWLALRPRARALLVAGVAAAWLALPVAASLYTLYRGRRLFGLLLPVARCLLRSR